MRPPAEKSWITPGTDEIRKRGLRRRLGWVAAACAVGAAAALLAWQGATYPNLVEHLRHGVSPEVFLVLMSVLPAAGFPISPFLVLAGLKFGFLLGTALTGLTTLLHLACALGLGRSLLRPWLLRWLRRRGRQPPALSPRNRYGMVFLFVLVPGLPYSLKNYLLAVSDLPLPVYLVLAWTGQMLIALPFIGLGEAAGRMQGVLVGGMVAVFIVAYLLRRHVTGSRR